MPHKTKGRLHLEMTMKVVIVAAEQDQEHGRPGQGHHAEAVDASSTSIWVAVTVYGMKDDSKIYKYNILEIPDIPC